jgi:site-specific DNA recombinase
MWMGGSVPLGYDVADRKLRINVEEAKTVQLLFQLYLKLGCVRRVQEETHQLGLVTKVRKTLHQNRSGGTPFSRGHLYLILLAGLLFTAEGVPFTPSHAVNHGKRYRYYAERSRLAEARGTTDKPKQTVSGADGKPNAYNGKGWRLPAHQIEQLILKQLAEFLRDHGALLDTLGTGQRRSPDQVSALLKHASMLAKLCDGSRVEQLDVVSALVRRVSIASTQMTIEISREAFAVDNLNRDGRSAPEVDLPAMQIEVPIELRRRGVETKLIVLGRQGSASEPDANLLKALTRAHDWLGRIVRGEANGPGDIARSERLCRTYVTRVLCVALLAPDITKGLLEGRQPSELTTKKLIRSALHVPLLWTDQRAFFGCGSPPTNVSAKSA